MEFKIETVDEMPAKLTSNEFEEVYRFVTEELSVLSKPVKIGPMSKNVANSMMTSLTGKLNRRADSNQTWRIKVVIRSESGKGYKAANYDEDMFVFIKKVPFEKDIEPNNEDE